MQAPPHVLRHLLLPHQHNHRQQHHRRRRGIRIHVSALLLSLVLLTDKPEPALGWVHNSPRAGGRRQGGRSPASVPGPATSPVSRLRVLHLLALERQWSWRRCSSPRLAGATDTDRGMAVPVALRDRVDRMKEWGVKGMWREAMEQLEEERSGGLTPVSRLLLWN